MPDDGTDATAGQVPDATQTTENVDQTTSTDATSTDAANTDQADQASTEEEFDKDRALATIRKMRGFEKTANQLQSRLAEYERREKEAEMAKLSEKEQLEARLRQRDAELEHERQQARDTINRLEVEKQAASLGIIDPEAAAVLLDWSQMEYDDAGKPTNVADALKELAEAKPYLVARADTGTQRSTGSPTNAATRSPSSSTRIYTAAEIADRAFWNANQAEIMKALREGRIRD